MNEITGMVIGSAISVHRELGPGLLESTYLSALCIELDERRVKYRREAEVPVLYRGRRVGTGWISSSRRR